MSGLYLSRGMFPQEFLRPTVDFILATQESSGEIPWFAGGHSDPWDHVEAAMGLTIGGEYDAAVKAYQWLARTQLEDGSWWAGYRGHEVDNGERRETNFVAHFATGVWHHFLVTGPSLPVRRPSVARSGCVPETGWEMPSATSRSASIAPGRARPATPWTGSTRC